MKCKCNLPLIIRLSKTSIKYSWTALNKTALNFQMISTKLIDITERRIEKLFQPESNPTK